MDEWRLNSFLFLFHRISGTGWVPTDWCTVDDGLCLCSPLGMADKVAWLRRIRVGYHREARGEALGGRTCSRKGTSTDRRFNPMY